MSTTTTANTSSPRVLLRGEIDGRERQIELAVGEYRVGCSRASDVCLPAQGVSRQHALLKVTAGGLVVEDRGSKNGTFVDERRVERAGVPIGAELAFGPVRLTVEAVESDDAELALVVDLGPPDSGPTPKPSRFSRWETTALIAGCEATVPIAWLGLIEGFVERLAKLPLSDLSSALGFLVEGLGAESGCVVEWVGGRPLALNTWGEVEDIPPLHELEGRRDAAGVLESQAPLSSAFLRASDETPLSLLIWGDFTGRAHSAPLLRTMLRCIDQRRPPSLHRSDDSVDGTDRGPRPKSADELVFPADYRQGSSSAMTTLYGQMRPLVSAKLSVLITGETGVGKERLARILHASSDRRSGPFVAINCAAIPTDLLEAELFGIGRGVATGVEPRDGKFLEANGGSLFLDEVGEMLPALQVKLLRVLQEKEVHPLGGKPRRIDVRILAATNADLYQRMEEGRFRRDLYYRLTGFTLEVPALRDCRDDIPALVEHFLRRMSHEAGKRVRGITVKALRLLTRYAWPGNVRELEHEMQRLAYLASDGGVIKAGMLSRPMVGTTTPAEPSTAEPDSLALDPALQRLEEQLIREALERTDHRQINAARLLGISRNGLANKMKRLGIQSRRKGAR